MVKRKTPGLKFERYFTKGNEQNVYDTFDWERGNVDISDDEGKILFTQKGVEFPKKWSGLARKIVASKYFFGEQKTSDREYSARQLVGRVVDTFYDWAEKQNYFSSREEREAFRDDLAFSVLDQRMAFNSPVWFNVGIDKISKGKNIDEKEAYIIRDGKVRKIPIGEERKYPQTSACFIQSVEDTMEDIMDLAKREALLFKYGSGTGTNLSPLRSSKEKLSGGGKPSGPLAYWAFYDKVAGIVKSGGKTRRAAKMDILNVEHPDISEFIHSKRTEEGLLHILIDNGVDPKRAQESVNYQNTNISVRASDDFMNAVENDQEWQTIPIHCADMADEMPRYSAKGLLKEIAESAYHCGDPGIQFDTTINTWHTCPKSGRINSSNPCSEYMFLDDSSCNLASINLMKFLNQEGVFNVGDFTRTVRTTAIAQDLEIDNSSYPTKKIASNSYRFRPLGMGYANLGSLVMSLGLPYDSDGARTIAASITALMTGKVYETSTEIAEHLGPFKEFKKNRQDMLNVMYMHKEELKNIDKIKLPEGLENILEEAEAVWDRVIERGEAYGFRNAQATALAPTGTIGLMMDCDTKGVEPEIGLVQTKLLSDGGILRLVNRTVKTTLSRMGYTEDQIENISKYIEEHETVEGAEDLKEEHLPVFDCSNKPKDGKRTISYQGHLKMMAAVQPFLSGAMSKTVNLPNETTLEEIEDIYRGAWKMGIKSIALYRDGSKRMQPLSFSKRGLEGRVGKPARRKLPTTSNSIRHKFNISGHKGYLHVGLFEDGTPGEVFMNMSKEGSTIGGLMDTIGILTSFCIQYGVPLNILIKKFRHQTFEPRGLVYKGHRDIKTANSIVDYVFHFIQKQFNVKINNKNNNLEFKMIEEETDNNVNNEEDSLEEIGGFCPVCGTQMTKKGGCVENCSVCYYQHLTDCGGG